MLLEKDVFILGEIDMWGMGVDLQWILKIGGINLFVYVVLVLKGSVEVDFCCYLQFEVFFVLEMGFWDFEFGVFGFCVFEGVEIGIRFGGKQIFCFGRIIRE